MAEPPTTIHLAAPPGWPKPIASPLSARVPFLSLGVRVKCRLQQLLGRSVVAARGPSGTPRQNTHSCYSPTAAAVTVALVVPLLVP